jgi:hypothetical protein
MNSLKPEGNTLKIRKTKQTFKTDLVNKFQTFFFNIYNAVTENIKNGQQNNTSKQMEFEKSLGIQNNICQYV